METLKYMGAELVAKKGDECMAYSWEVHALEGWNEHECGYTMSNIQKVWQPIESSSWISTFDALR